PTAMADCGVLACLHVSRLPRSTTLRTRPEKGTKCGRASVSTHFQRLPDSARRAFCAPSRCRWHADPPAGCTDTIVLKLCGGSLSICDSIARTAAFAFADGGRIQRR